MLYKKPILEFSERQNFFLILIDSNLLWPRALLWAIGPRCDMYQFMFRVFFILFFLASPGFSSIGLSKSDCSGLTNTCDFYLCLEEEFLCGRKGYPLSFGYKFCKKYEQNLEYFSDSGIQWVDKTRSCLIDKLILLKNVNSCRDLKKQAFKQHSGCYFQSGYCRLSQADKEVVIYTLKRALWNPRVISEGIRLKRQCLNQ